MKNTHEAIWNSTNQCLIINSIEIQKYRGKWRVWTAPEVEFKTLEEAINFAINVDNLSIADIETMAWTNNETTTTPKTIVAKCAECGKKYYSIKSAEKAYFGDGCPKCGGADIEVL